MAIDLTKIAKTIKLNLDEVPRDQRATVKREVGQYVVDEILRHVSQGSSPVEGRGAFKSLNEDYADAEKGGDRNPNLELDGDMLDSLTFKNSKEGVEVGIFKSREVPKADGHNNFSGKSNLPTRRFIPDSKEDFKNNIERGIKDIVKEYEEAPTETDNFFRNILTIEESERKTDIQVGDLFSDDFLQQYLKEEGFI